MFKPVLFAAGLTLAATPALTDEVPGEVNVYTSRQPELIQPIFDAFTAETGIEVNVLYSGKGLIERMKAEASRSPADLYITADIANVKAATDAGLTQPHGSTVVDGVVPAELRDAGGHWFALTTRARVVYASKERVAKGAVTTYEDLADRKWKGRICIRPGSHSYNLSLIAAMIAHHGPEQAREWVRGMKANLARTPQGNDRAQVKAVWAGECDIAIGNTYYMGKMLAKPDQRARASAVNVAFPLLARGRAQPDTRRRPDSPSPDASLRRGRGWQRHGRGALQRPPRRLSPGRGRAGPAPAGAGRRPRRRRRRRARHAGGGGP